MGLSEVLPVWSYLSLTVVALCFVSTAGIVTKCPRPTVPVIVTKQNQRNLLIDSTSYSANVDSLPVKCVSEDFIPADDLTATCQNGMWKLPQTKCVPMIYRERKVTNTIMAIIGAVGGTFSAVFIIVKVICYRRSRSKEQRGHEGSMRFDDIEMTSDGRVASMNRNLRLQTDRQSAHLYTQSVVSGHNSQHYDRRESRY